MGKKKKRSASKPNHKPIPEPTADQFGLAKPSPEMSELHADPVDSKETAEGNPDDHYISTEKHLHDAEVKFKAMGWRGVDDEEEEIEAGFGGEKEKIPEDELDMTPMVDVTFLLLIFFMVTASFSLQKSIQQPPAQTDAPSSTVQEKEEVVDDYVEVIIDQNDTYYVTTRDESEKEAPSDREMRERLKDAKNNSSATRLVIKAHLDCKHSKVVTAWDAGIAVGMNKIEIQTTEQDF